MATTTETVTLTGLADSLYQTGVRAKDVDFKEIFKGPVLDEVRSGILHNFETAQSPDGQTWPPRKHSYPWPILVKTGDMQRSVTEDGGEGYVLVEETSLAIVSTVEYAGIHNRGTSSMPQREFLGQNDESLKRTDDIIADGVLDQIFGSG